MPASRKTPAAKKPAPPTNVGTASSKGDKQLHRDTLGALAKTVGLPPASLVAIDDVWSAMQCTRA